MKSTSKTASRRRAFGLGVAAVALGLFCGVGLGEIGLRLLSPAQLAPAMDARDLVQFDPLLGWRNRPGHMTVRYSPDYETDARIGSEGFRDRDPGHRKTPNRLRVLCVGDSFTWGMGVEQAQAYPKVLETLLKGRAEVINAGVIGWGTAQEWLWLQNEGMRYAPDIVVLGFYVNDFEDNATAGDASSPRPLFVIRNDRLELTNVPLTKPGNRWLTSAASALLRHFYFARAIEMCCRWLARSTNAVNMKPLRRAARWSAGGSVGIPAETVTAALLDRVQRLCADNDAQLIAVLIPGAWDVNGKHDNTPRSAFERAEYDAVLKICRTNQIRFIDMRPILTAKEKTDTRAYHTVDIHWTAAGHRAAAATLLEEIARRSSADLP